MCGLCGVPTPMLHWSESPGRGEGPAASASAAPARAQRLRRVQCLDTVMRAYACTVSDWQGRAYQVTTFTGKTALVDDLSEIWATVEKLTGRTPSPLDDAVLDRFDPARRLSPWVSASSSDEGDNGEGGDGDEGSGDDTDRGGTDGGYLGRLPLSIHFGVGRTVSLTCSEAIDWTGFGCWLTMLLHAEGDRIAGVNALLDVCDVPSPVRLRGRYRTMETPVCLGKWRGAPIRSTLTLIGDLPAASRLGKSLEMFATVQKAL